MVHIFGKFLQFQEDQRGIPGFRRVLSQINWGHNPFGKFCLGELGVPLNLGQLGNLTWGNPFNGFIGFRLGVLSFREKSLDFWGRKMGFLPSI